MNFNRYKREISALVAYVALLLAVAAIAPSFFGGGTLRDLVINKDALKPYISEKNDSATLS